MWTIITKEDAAAFARVSEAHVEDLWYSSIIGVIETLTSWYSLSGAVNVTETLSGHGSPLLNCKYPINTVSSITINSTSIPMSMFHVAWDHIAFKDNYNTGIATYASSYTEFPAGFGNVVIAYNVGGTASLPLRYRDVLPTVMLLSIKELIAIPRNEGSDTTLKKYRPNYTPTPEDTLKAYGVHGKISAIVKTYLPCKLRPT